jgi:IclR family pca regulon transcriptional regulator
VLLAALPEGEARAILSVAPLPARTPHTLTDPDAILAELGRVKDQGYALIDQEVELGLRSMAMPLFSARGAVVGAINVGVPATQVGVEELVPLYLEALRRLQAELRAVLS